MVQICMSMGFTKCLISHFGSSDCKPEYGVYFPPRAQGGCSSADVEFCLTVDGQDVVSTMIRKGSVSESMNLVGIQGIWEVTNSSFLK